MERYTKQLTIALQRLFIYKKSVRVKEAGWQR